MADVDPLVASLTPSIEIVGYTEREGEGISRQELIAAAETAAAEVHDAKEVESLGLGYSLGELSQILAAVEELRAAQQDSAARRLLAANQLVNRLEQIQAERLLSDREQAVIAAAVQQKYTEAGYIFTRVLPQAYDGQSLTLRIVEGRLGQVAVNGNEIHEDSTLRSVFSALEGEVVRKDMLDRAFYVLNDYDGLSAVGVFRPGAAPGSADLDVDIQNERGGVTRLYADNTRADITGRWAAGFAQELYDLTDHADTLSFGADRTEEVIQGFVRYGMPLPMNPLWSVSGGARANNFAVGLGSNFEVEARVLGVDAMAERTLRRSQEFNAAVSAQIAYDDATLDVLANDSLVASSSTDQKITSVTLGATIDGRRSNLPFEGFSTAFEVSGRAKQGFLDGELQGSTDGFPGQNSEFTLFSVDAQSFTIFTLPLGERELDQQLLMRFSGRYSEQALPAVTQFTLGGANGVRGFLLDDLAVDSGAFASIQSYTKLPDSIDGLPDLIGRNFGTKFRPFVFLDYAYGTRNALRTNASTLEDRWAQMISVGLGLDYYLLPVQDRFALQGSLTIGWPVDLTFATLESDPNFGTSIEDDEARIFFSISYALDRDTMSGLIPGR